MLQRSKFLAIGGTLLASLLWFVAVPLSAKDETKPAAKTETQPKPVATPTAMQAFMRRKLALSQDIMEGLAVEDFELIERGAIQLKAMSMAAEFLSLKDALYVEHADQFRRTLNKLQTAAKDKRLDGATLGFVDMTMSCVDCHKRVRALRASE